MVEVGCRPGAQLFIIFNFIFSGLRPGYTQQQFVAMHPAVDFFLRGSRDCLPVARLFKVSVSLIVSCILALGLGSGHIQLHAFSKPDF